MASVSPAPHKHVPLGPRAAVWAKPPAVWAPPLRVGTGTEGGGRRGRLGRPSLQGRSDKTALVLRGSQARLPLPTAPSGRWSSPRAEEASHTWKDLEGPGMHTPESQRGKSNPSLPCRLPAQASGWGHPRGWGCRLGLGTDGPGTHLSGASASPGTAGPHSGHPDPPPPSLGPTVAHTPQPQGLATPGLTRGRGLLHVPDPLLSSAPRRRQGRREDVPSPSQSPEGTRPCAPSTLDASGPGEVDCEGGAPSHPLEGPRSTHPRGDGPAPTIHELAVLLLQLPHDVDHGGQEGLVSRVTFGTEIRAPQKPEGSHQRPTARGKRAIKTPRTRARRAALQSRSRG